MTRHRDDLKVFVDRSALPNYDVMPMHVGRHGLADLEQSSDGGSDKEIIAAIGKSMERTTAPRNALDVLGLPESVMSTTQAMAARVPPEAANATKLIGMFRDRLARQAEIRRQAEALRAARPGF
jgi:hypothetical protein